MCNRIRLIIQELTNNVIGKIIVTGNYISNKVYISQMSMIPSNPKTSLIFQRRQFSVPLCFVMTINKSQGQSLLYVGLFLRKPVFIHRQFYVTILRVKSKSRLKILILNDNEIYATKQKI